MNRNQRRLGRCPKRTDSEARVKVKPKHGADSVEEVFAPRASKKEVTPSKPMTNRCCHVSPDQREFGQHTDEYQDIMLDQYNFNPIIPDTITQLQELRRMLCGSSHKVENSSQYAKPLSAFVETSDGAQWQNVENADDIDRFILGKDEETLTQGPNFSKSVFISEVPRVKIIVEKFSRIKQNNVELRKLDEKVVCVEYDVFDQYVDDSQPVQIMRAFFSIKPVYDEDDKTRSSLSELPPKMKNKFNIAFEDLQKLSEKEVEMIDGKIAENQPYLDDLRKILRRKQVVSKKDKNSLDTKTLYEMATMEYLNFERDNANLLSKDELQEVKDLILKKCKSSVHGISRRTVKCESETGGAKEIELNAISKSIVAELLRQEGRDVFN